MIDTKLSSLSGRVKYRDRCSISKVQVVVSLVNLNRLLTSTR